VEDDSFFTAFVASQFTRMDRHMGCGIGICIAGSFRLWGV
jgi:hypothetical protein